MKKLEGKVALITGGNSGIGLATAKLFRAEGARVVVTASTKNSFERAQKEMGEDFDIVQTDVANDAELDSLMEHMRSRYQGIDVLVANAGIANFCPTAEVTAAFFDQMNNVNVRGLFFTVQKALPLLKKHSSVILTSSNASIKGFPGAAVYSATKAAVRSFSRSWTAEIPAEQARFNVVSPGPVETPIFEKSGMTAEQIAGFKAQMISMVPARRFGKAEELAHTYLYLASDDSRFVLGSDFFVDGGSAQV